MGSTQSSVVKNDEIAIHIQRMDYFSNPLLGSLRMNEPKPYQLSSISDDAWAGLQLRIDPLAQRIALPSRTLYGLAALTFICGAALLDVIRPHNNNSEDNDDLFRDDFDDYSQSGPSADAEEGRMEQQEVESKRAFWMVMFFPLFVFLTGVTIGTAIHISKKNEKIDEQIHMALNEIAPRLAFQGFSVEYRRQHTGFCQSCGTTPERVIVFRQLFGVGATAQTEVMMVSAPMDAYAGQNIQIITPSGMLMQVSVPPGIEPGQDFPVHIPIKKVAAFGHLS